MPGEPHDWENPAVVGINKRKAHVPLRSYTSASQAAEHYRLASEAPPSPRLLSLNGDSWRFRLFDRPEAVPEGFHQPGFGPGAWTAVTVPTNWECQDFGRPQYTNFEYPFPVEPPFVPADNPTGCYRLSFDVPEAAVSPGHRWGRVAPTRSWGAAAAARSLAGYASPNLNTVVIPSLH